MSGFNFGTPSTQFGFGSGTASSTPAGGGFQFGQTAPAASNMLGSGTGALNFNQPATGVATSLPSFGSNTGTGFNFGSALSTPSTGFGFGSNSSGTGLNMAMPASTAGTCFNLGTPGSTATPGLFPNASAPKNLFNTPTTGLTFGAPATTTTPSLNFGFGSSSTAPAGGLNFGAPTAVSTATSAAAPGLFGTLGSGGLGLGTTTTAAAPTIPTLGLSFGTSTAAPSLFPTTTPPTLSFGTGISAITAPPTSKVTEKVGLGGITTTTQSQLGPTAAKTVKEVPPKQQQIPNEIYQDVQNFQNFIKNQKAYSSEISRCCIKHYKEIDTGVQMVNNVLNDVEASLLRNKKISEGIKFDTALAFQNLEMAQRTQDTPSGLQYDNVAPLNFFMSLIDSFEKEMQALKLQIENTDKYVRHTGTYQPLSPFELSLGMRRLHETFVTLAGRLQSIHAQVEGQKEMYFNLLKSIAGEVSDPFANIQTVAPATLTQLKMQMAPKIICGPTPFNNVTNTSNLSYSNNQQASPTAASQTAQTNLGASTLPLSLQQGNLSFGLSKDNTLNWSQSSGFQLDKPPAGIKRGKT